MGFIQPLFLWFGALALPLVLLYILKTRRQQRRVPATFLWQSVLRDLEARVPFRRLRRDWLLLLQLLVLVLLVVAAAGPYRRVLLAAGGRSAIIVDASAGMQAGRRFAEARQATQGLVDGMGPRDQVVLLRAGPRPQVVVPLTRDRRALRAGVERLEPGAAPADLAAALELARGTVGDRGRMVLVTARSFPASQPVAGSREEVSQDLQVVEVGEPSREMGNVGIVTLGVRPSDASGRNHQVFVRLHNASQEDVSGTLGLSVDSRPVDATQVHLGPEASVSRTLQILAVEQGLLEVAWQGTSEDPLALDDRAFWVLRRPEPRRYHLKGRVDPYMRRALATYTDWREAGAGETFDVEIIGRETSDPALDASGPPFLWIDPASGRTGEVEGATVLAWDRTHPALRFAELRSLRLGRVPRFRRPSGARVLAESSAGPLILEGSTGQRRCLIWAFDPLESDLPLRAAFPLLVRNALEHLAPQEGSLDGGLATGVARAVAWTGAGEVRLIAPSGRAFPLAVSAGLIRLPPLEEIGVWRLEDGRRTLRFGASLVNPGQSDLRNQGSQQELGPVRQRTPRSQTQSTPGPLWRPLALLALLLLLVEETVRQRAHGRRVRPHHLLRSRGAKS